MLAKLYPWEWLAADEFGSHLLAARVRVIEPAWKMLLSNKGLLAVLWELFPGHANLLPASFDPHAIEGEWVEKPLLSREGANVAIHHANATLAAPGTIPRFGDDYVTIGSWVIGDEPAGIGLREDTSEITCNTSRFVPHYFV